MKFPSFTRTFCVFSLIATAAAQVASHSPNTLAKQNTEQADNPTMSLVKLEASGKPVIRVNGTVLTDRDLLHEMYSLFPYAEQHKGFPKGMESEIRSGAKQMLIFEELVYQEGERRKTIISQQKINAAAEDLRKQFPSDQAFQGYLNAECNGSRQVLRQKIRRSMIIDAVMKQEIDGKSTPTLAELRAYYLKHPDKFSHGEMFHIQTISVIPPEKGGAEAKKEAKKRAEDAYKAAQKAKTFQEFGLLAEKYSEDDWHVNMGDRPNVSKDTLPPPLIAAAQKMKPGEISPLIQLGDNYTLFRLVARTPAGKAPFQSVRKSLAEDYKKGKTEQLRSQLNQRLHKGAKIQEL